MACRLHDCVIHIHADFGIVIKDNVLPDFMGSSGRGHICGHVHVVVGDGKHSHAQTFIFYLVLVCL